MSITHSWERRPRAPRGDTTPDRIFYLVGLALTLWETTESEISIAYAGLLRVEEYGVNGYFTTSSFEARYKLVQKAIVATATKKIVVISASS